MPKTKSKKSDKIVNVTDKDVEDICKILSIGFKLENQETKTIQIMPKDNTKKKSYGNVEITSFTGSKLETQLCNIMELSTDFQDKLKANGF